MEILDERRLYPSRGALGFVSEVRSHPRRWPRGIRQGPWGIIALLSAGGRGEVHRARDARTKRRVAVTVAVERRGGAKSLFKRPSLGAILLALLPFAAMCFSVPLWDRVHPMLLGIPFNLFWLIAWIVLSTLCMWAAYRVEAARDKKDGETR